MVHGAVQADVAILVVDVSHFEASSVDFPSAGVSFADHQLQLLVDSQTSCNYVCGCVWIHPDTTQKFEPKSWNTHFSWGLQVSTTAVLNIDVNSSHQAGFDRGGQTKEHLQLAGMPRCPPRACFGIWVRRQTDFWKLTLKAWK